VKAGKLNLITLSVNAREQALLWIIHAR
jgi:hypothetical protein